jgi:hypothetical protein
LLAAVRRFGQKAQDFAYEKRASILCEHQVMGLQSACKLRGMWKQVCFLKKDNNKPTRLIFQVIRYRNRDKE